MKKIFSFSIGLIFTAVVLCFTASPLIMSLAANEETMSGCSQSDDGNQEQPGSACDHQADSVAQFQSMSQGSESILVAFQQTIIRSILEEFVTIEPRRSSLLTAVAPPGLHSSYLAFSKTVVLRF